MGMTRCMASELGEQGITCNAIMPGMTDSEVEYIGRTEQSLGFSPCRKSNVSSKLAIL